MHVCETLLSYPKEGSCYILRQQLHPVPDCDLDGDPASLGKAGREPA